MAQLGDTVITGSLSVTNSIHGTADNAINAIALSDSYTCSTAAATAAKVLTIPGTFTLQRGARVVFSLTNANSATGPLTLNVNGTGAKTLIVNGTTTSASSYTMAANTYVAMYDGTYWRVESSSYTPFPARSAASATDCSYPETKWEVYCDTAAGTAAKVGRCRSYIFYNGTIVSIRITATNTAENPTLNVNSQGAKDIYVNGTKIATSNKGTLTAGLYIGYYDNSVWQLMKTNAPSFTVDSLYSPDVAFSYTAAGTATKKVIMPSFNLVAGTRFRLYLVNTSSVGTAKLDVNELGAKEVRISGAATTTSNFTAGWHDVVYDGTYFQVDTAFQPDWTQTDNTKADFIKNKIPIWITSGTAVDSTATILLNMVYPVGSVYMSVNNVSPQSFLGGTWKAITDGRFVRASGENAASVPTIAQINAGTGIQAEGLPNITGSISNASGTYGVTGFESSTNSFSGALSGDTFSGKSHTGSSSDSGAAKVVNLNASNGNSTVPDGASSGKIYGNSNHVTPKNMSVYMWVRTA